MNKIFLAIAFLLTTVISFAQFPGTQTSGSSKTLSRFGGGVQADSGFVINSFPDTLTANYGFLKNIAGLQIRVVDTVYVRAECKCKWNVVGYVADWGVDSPLLVSSNTLSIDTTSNKGVATKFDLSQVSSTTVGEGITNYGNILRWADTLTASKNFNVVGDTYSMYTRWLSLYGGSYTTIESRAYKNDGSEYSFVGIQPSGTSLQTFINGKTNALRVQGFIDLSTQDSGKIRILSPLPTALPTDSVLARGADNIIRLKAVSSSTTDTALIRTIVSDSVGVVRGALSDTASAIRGSMFYDANGSFNGDRTVDANGYALNFNNLGWYNAQTTDGNTFVFFDNSGLGLGSTNGGSENAINFNSSGAYISSSNGISKSSINLDSSFINITTYDSIRLQGSKLTINIPSASAGKVLTASDTYGTATWQTLPSDVDNEPIVNAMQALGSSIKATTVGVDVSKIAAAAAFSNNVVYYMVTYIPNDTTLTGVTWFQTAQGNYTASGYNGVGLYSYSGGTWTLVASSTDDGDIWKAAANTYGTKAFSSTYRAKSGVYAIAINFNRSAVTTAPTIARGGGLANLAVSAIGTNSAKLYSSSSGSSFPATIAASSQTSVNTPYFLGVY